MKLLILLLSFNLYAQFKIEIIPSNDQHAKMQLDAESEELVKEELAKWIERQKTYKGEWSDKKKDSIAEKEITDLEGKKVKLYYKPIDFSVNLVDETEKINAEKAEKEERKNEIKQLKKDIRLINDSDLPQWHKKLLKRLIKELKE